MNKAEEFEELRALLFSIAYRILGSVSEAEDAVQETWLRFDRSTTLPTSAKAFLSATVTRVSIDVLRSARVRREQYAGPWLPEPLLSDPERSAELADSVSVTPPPRDEGASRYAGWASRRTSPARRTLIAPTVSACVWW
ncbi:sigma factor, partial [Streptomyces sp. NPDC005070]